MLLIAIVCLSEISEINMEKPGKSQINAQLGLNLTRVVVKRITESILTFLERDW